MIFRQATVVFGTAAFIVMYFSASKFFDDIDVLAQWYKSIVGTVWLGRKQLAIVMALLPALLILRYAKVLGRLSKCSGWAIGLLGLSSLAHFTSAGWPLNAPSALVRPESIGVFWGWAFHVILICALVVVLLQAREPASPTTNGARAGNRIFIGLTILLAVFLNQWRHALEVPLASGLGFPIYMRLAYYLDLMNGLLEVILAVVIVHWFVKLARVREVLAQPVPGLGVMTCAIIVYVVTYVASVKHFARLALEYVGIDSHSLLRLAVATHNVKEVLFFVAGCLLIAGTFRLLANLPRPSETDQSPDHAQTNPSA